MWCSALPWLCCPQGVSKDREWIMRKKETQRKQGKQVCHDSKYSGRKRSKVRF